MRCRLGLLRVSLPLLTALCLVGIPKSVHAQRVPLDFNRDGISELLVIKVANVLRWQPVDSSSGALMAVGLIGVPGDHVILADWNGSGVPQMGVARLDGATKEIVWRVKDDTGKALETRLGRAGDIAAGGIDLNGNGSADGVLIKRSGRRLRWVVAFDALAGGTTRSEFAFGTSKETPFFLGTSLATFARKSDTTEVKLLDPVSGKRTVYSKLPKLPRRRKSTSVFALTSGEGAVNLAVLQSSAEKSWLSLVDMSTKKSRRKIRTVAIPSAGVAAVGNFLPNPGQEVAIDNSGSVLVVNPFDNGQRAISVPEGVLVDEINFNPIGKTSSPDVPDPDPAPPVQNPDPAAPPTDPGTPSAGSLAEVCARTSSIAAGEMLIKQEASEHIHNGDSRTTGYTVVCSRLCPANQGYARFFYADGTEAGAVARYGLFAGNGQPRMYGAVGAAPQHFSSEIARRAAGIGNGKLYLQMSQETSGPNTWCKEFNPTGRNGSL